MAQRQKRTVSQLELFSMWDDTTRTRCEVARDLGVTQKALGNLARQHNLPPRPRADRATRAENNPPPDVFSEPEASDSLDLCPWVQARISELRLHEVKREKVFA